MPMSSSPEDSPDMIVLSAYWLSVQALEPIVNRLDAAQLLHWW
jgi:hypothetical protein